MEVVARLSRWLGALADRLGITPVAIVAGGAAVVAAGLGAWWAFSAPDPPPPETILPRAAALGPAAPQPDVTTTSVPAVIVVHVDGAVVVPGVHELAEGSRVVDAIAAAQGLAADADRSRLNLAEPLVDGQRLWVPVVGEDEPPVVGPVGGVAAAGGEAEAGPVDLNTADQAVLETLPGVGPAIAGAIVEHRDRHGPFGSVQELLEVPGIGPTRLARLEALVRV